MELNIIEKERYIFSNVVSTLKPFADLSIPQFRPMRSEDALVSPYIDNICRRLELILHMARS